MPCLCVSLALKPLPDGKVVLACQQCGRVAQGAPQGGVYPRAIQSFEEGQGRKSLDIKYDEKICRPCCD